MRAERTARASHRVAVRKIDSIEESSVPARVHAALSRSPPDRRQSYGYGSGSVGVISLAEAVIRGTPSPAKGKYTGMGDILHGAHCTNKLVVVLEHENQAVSSCFSLVRELLFYYLSNIDVVMEFNKNRPPTREE